MIGQLNSLLPPIRSHTSLFYRQTFHPITDIFSLLLSILVPPPRETEREREEREELEHNQHLLLLLLLALSRLPFFQHTLALLPSDADWMQTGGFPAASWVSAPFLPSSLYPPLSLSLLLLFFPTSEASLLLPPLFYPFHTTRMWHSVALLLSGFSAMIHGEPAFMSLSVCLSHCFQGIGLQQHFRGIRALGSTLLMLDLQSMQWNKNSRK